MQESAPYGAAQGVLLVHEVEAAQRLVVHLSPEHVPPPAQEIAKEGVRGQCTR